MKGTMRIEQRLKHDKSRATTSPVSGRHLRGMTRVLECLLFLAVISWFTLTLPYMLRHVSVTLVSTPFIFVIGNAIVLTLVLKSGAKLTRSRVAPQPKTTTFIVSVCSPTHSKASGVGKLTPAKEVVGSCYRRTKSERIGGGRDEQVLRRTKTERVERHLKPVSKGDYPADRMSRDEFRRTVEDFIARQQRFLKEEEDEECFSE